MLRCLVAFLALTSIVKATSYSNPVIPRENCPDPGIVHDHNEQRYFVATTTDYNTDPDKFPIHSSSDLVQWTNEGHIFPAGHLPKWARSDFWAPEIHIVGGRYLVYYVARDTTGVGHSSNIRGPYEDIGAPLVRNSTVGMIDPTYFFDEVEKRGYLVWKEDGNGKFPFPEKYTPIWAQPLSADGLKLEGSRTMILKNDPASWEGPLVEGPWIIKKDDVYFLFYSANGYLSTKYAVGVAKATNILGPYTKYHGNPIIHSNENWSGPGHCAVARVANSTEPNDFFVVYHSWAAGKISFGNPRLLLLDAIIWTEDNWPIVKDRVPSSGPTPVPTLDSQ